MLSKIFGRKSDADTCPADVIRMRDGRLLTIRFFGHASIAFEYEGRHIYVDPVMKYADYGRLPKADAILVTHPHYDHFDMEAVEALRKEGTAILCDAPRPSRSRATAIRCCPALRRTLWKGCASMPWRHITPRLSSCSSTRAKASSADIS